MAYNNFGCWNTIDRNNQDRIVRKIIRALEADGQN